MEEVSSTDIASKSGNKWVKFEDERESKVQIEMEASPSTSTSQMSVSSNSGGTATAIIPTESIRVNQNIDMRNVDLHESSNGETSRPTFANGDVIVTLLPVNSSLPWITPAKFRPELVPEELMAKCLTLTVEDYVHAMEMLTNDFRFKFYNICYKRVLLVWIFIGFVGVLAMLFSGLEGLPLFSYGLVWLLVNAMAVASCVYIKIQLVKNLDRCMARVNRYLLRHHIILGYDDRGKMSCHKVNLCFIYFDATDCIKKLQEIIETEEAAGNVIDHSSRDGSKTSEFQERMDIDDQDIVIHHGTGVTRLSRKQERSELLLVRYTSAWARAMLGRKLTLHVDRRDISSPFSGLAARHCVHHQCLCQYIEQHVRFKSPKGKFKILSLVRWKRSLLQRGLKKLLFPYSPFGSESF